MARGKNAKPGETRISPNGYHYTRTKVKWELTGRLVAGKARGFPLTKSERVRYLDGNPLNLEPENIEVFEVKRKSPKSQKARLEAKLEDLQAQLDLLE